MTDIRGLGYIKVQTTDMERWRKLAFEVLGFAKGSGPDKNALYLRMDERASRIVIVAGDADGVVDIGWEVRDHAALARVRAAVEAAGIAVKALGLEEADARRVEEVIAFQDPSGASIEIFHGAILDHSPVVTPFGAKFVTGTQGLGHVVLPVMDLDGAFNFYSEVLGFFPRGAFRLPAPPEYGPLRIRFMGVNERHHSLALCPSARSGAPGLIHVMVEVDTLDAVGATLDRVVKNGFSVSSTLGRHTNDKMVSFYVRAPGGWDIEFGTAGMKIDERTYLSEEITADSYWGHDWSGTEPLAAM
jgi:3,4-dihydroxy-9,10-secoandrosta-1,3,5(10)-triene-9,17-dione 4,5-dioxygenase